MEVNLLQRRPVNLGLRGAQPLEQFLRPSLSSGAQRRLIDESSDFLQRAVGVISSTAVLVAVFVAGVFVTVLFVTVLMFVGVMVVVAVIVRVRVPVMRMNVSMSANGLIFAADAELRRSNPGTRDLLGPDHVRRDRQAAKGAADIRERDAGVDERAEHHVAGGTAEAVEVQDPHNQTILPFSARQLAGFHERVVALVRKNEVIEHVDADDLTRLGQPHRQREIIGAGARISRWMVVEQHNRRRAPCDRFTEHLARVRDGGVERSG